LHKEIVQRFVVRQEALLGVLSAEERGDLDRLLGKLVASRFG
jgi:hypothetical protein